METLKRRFGICTSTRDGRKGHSDTVSRQPRARGEVGEGDSENQRDPYLPLSLNANWLAEPRRTTPPTIVRSQKKRPRLPWS